MPAQKYIYILFPTVYRRKISPFFHHAGIFYNPGSSMPMWRPTASIRSWRSWRANSLHFTGPLGSKNLSGTCCISKKTMAAYLYAETKEISQVGREGETNYMRERVCICICIFTHTYVRVHIYTNTNTHTCVCTYMYENNGNKLRTQLNYLSYTLPYYRGFIANFKLLRW